ncbi:hypothetical protein [Chimaeribacter arupi]|uniref:hypothetical protein n=1 Tax=Chimaeribacter arupi TaxID=2060066 RepID=UPI0013FCFFF4|nr:hypothetical protein [Chimaeribacter arupi]
MLIEQNMKERQGGDGDKQIKWCKHLAAHLCTFQNDPWANHPDALSHLLALGQGREGGF